MDSGDRERRLMCSQQVRGGGPNQDEGGLERRSARRQIRSAGAGCSTDPGLRSTLTQSLFLRGQVGRRDGFTAAAFIRDLADRLATRVQLTTDGHKVYLEAIEGAFGNAIDYAMLVKTYEGDSGKHSPAERRYSPAVCTGEYKQRITGDPDPANISTSFVERQNLTVRMQVRRFTRLTNAVSKKLDNHKAAVALHFMHYNFARIHQTFRVTPAMEAGISDHVWSIEEIVGLLETEVQSN
jgi:hypothetical protein